MKSKLPKGVYQRNGILYIRYTDESGRMVRESTRQSSVPLAEKIRAKRITEIAEDRHFPSKRHRSVKFGDLLDGWYRNHGRNTKSKFEYLVPEIKRRFSDVKARHISSDRIRDYLLERQADGLSASSLNHRITILSAVFKWAKEWKGFPDNPVLPIQRFKEPPGRDRVPSRGELSLLLRYAEAHDIELYVAVFIAAVTAFRKGEILTRRWIEVDVESSHPFILEPSSKNEKAKKVPLPRSVAEAITRLPSRGQSEYLFPCRPTGRYPTDARERRSCPASASTAADRSPDLSVRSSPRPLTPQRQCACPRKSPPHRRPVRRPYRRTDAHRAAQYVGNSNDYLFETSCS